MEELSRLRRKSEAELNDERRKVSLEILRVKLGEDPLARGTLLKKLKKQLALLATILREKELWPEKS